MLLIVWGTHIISKGLFDHSFKLLINIPYKRLPFLLKIVLWFFGDHKRFKNRELWFPEDVPILNNFPFKILLHEFNNQVQRFGYNKGEEAQALWKRSIGTYQKRRGI